MISLLFSLAMCAPQAAVAPNKQSLLVVSISSEMHGDLKCSGSEDNKQIQQAIDYFSSNGGEVVLSDGLFIITDQIILRSNVVLKGQGITQTTVKSSDNMSRFTKGAGTFRGVDLQNVVLRDFTGDGNRKNNVGDAYDRSGPVYGKFGFFCETCDNVNIQRVAMNSYTGYGFDPHGDGASDRHSNNVIIDNCYASDNNWDGFTIDKVSNGRITNNIAINNGRHGINIVTGR
jgi:parallel beta-helix repeat protein